jgi:hypothetical protein
MDFDEDRSQVRTASGPHIMASLRNLVVTILRLAGATSIAAALRYHARRPGRPLQTIMSANDFAGVLAQCLSGRGAVVTGTPRSERWPWALTSPCSGIIVVDARARAGP